MLKDKKVWHIIQSDIYRKLGEMEYIAGMAAMDQF